MPHYSKLKIRGSLVLVALLVASSASAALTITTDTQASGSAFTPTWPVATNNLIAGMLPSYSSGDFVEAGQGVYGVPVLTDGAIGPVGSGGDPFAMAGNGNGSGSTLIYTLPVSANGYNITNVTVFSGWGDFGRAGQAYHVSYATAANPTSFISLSGSTVNIVPASGSTPMAYRVMFADSAGAPIAFNVAAIKFDFTVPRVIYNFDAYSEITVQGTPAVTVIAPPIVITTQDLPTASGNSPAFTMETGSLIAGQLPTAAVNGGGTFDNSAGMSLANLTDGVFGTVNANTTYSSCGSNAGGASIVYTLPNSTNGCDLTNIVVYSGWGDWGRDGQFYDVSYSTVSAPTTFLPLTSVWYNNPGESGSPNAERTAITTSTGIPLATNVAAIKFNFSPQNAINIDYGWSAYAEIIVQGTGGTTLPVVPSWTNTTLSASQRASLLVNAMTFGEMATMVSAINLGNPYAGNIPANIRLGIPSLNLQDGPAGVADGVNSVTAFPAPITIAASWDVALARQYGSNMGAEARGKGVNVMLAPMMNIARAYQAGRNFEGSGEDPRLSGAIAAAEIQGIQSQGVIATAKHFICNDQETQRQLVSSEVDERTRQEVYYPPFRASVRAGVGAVMASYNRVNSRYACESEALNTTLKKAWGFNGFVMSDWGATFSTVAAANNGLDMDMYCGGFASTPLVNAIQSGNVPSSEVNGMVKRILTSMFQFGLFDNPSTGNLNANVASPAHSLFARDAAAQGTVLLQNHGGLLPLNPSSIHSIAVIGSVASVSPISVGAGSAGVQLPYNITPLAGITSRAGAGVTVNYSQGDGASISAAASLASTSDVAIICVGEQTSEGSDRTSLSLPNGQDALISAVAAVNPHTIVVIYSSSATLMPWASQVAGVLYAWYPGQENGNALAQVLFGDVNPSGKLPITIPASASQVCANTAAQFPGVRGHVYYTEGLQEGYRWYDANNVTPLFPFGFGLSYTTFGYSNLTVSAVSPSGQVQVGFDLSNLGTVAGAEVAQLYLGFPAAANEPPKWLKGFQKVFLTPGQSRHVTFNLDWEDLADWDATARGFIVTPGTFQVMVGASSRDLRLTSSFVVSSPMPSSDLANAALHQPVTFSSVQSTNYPGVAAVDGDTTTTWTSLASDPQWITVDLGLSKDLSRVRLRWGTNYATSYMIQVSADNTNWTGIYTNNSGDGGVEDLLVAGRGRYVRMYGMARAGGGGYSLAELEVYSQPQLPFGGTARTLPGVIQAEDYDTGGESVAYYNTNAANDGGAYRTDDVSIEATTDTGGGYDVNSLNNGEWLEYTVNVPDAEAIYSLSARVASPSGGAQLRVRLDGTVLGTLQISNTGGGQNWQTVTLPNVPLPGGTGSRALRLEVLNAGFNLNWIRLDRVQVCGTNNIALNQPATASSVESSAYSAGSANDGDLTTRWSSAFSDPQWLMVDLGSVQNISRVRLNWENSFATSYSLQVSTNGNTWTSVYATTNGTGSINDLAALGTGRYVRAYSTQREVPSKGNSLWEFEVYPTPQMPVISGINPAPSSLFVDPAGGLSFNISSAVTNIPTSGVLVIVNGIDVSSQLVFTGSAMNWHVSFSGLLPNQFNSVTINVTDAAGSFATASVNNFDTFGQNNFTIEAEDFDFGGGQFIDNPMPTSGPATNSYNQEATPAVTGIDLTTTFTGSEVYRSDPCGTQVATDFLRQKFLTAGVSDYNVGWWDAGNWLNYTRTFPTNNYYIYGRLSSGNATYGASCSLVNSGRGTATQTTQVLGTFNGAGAGWQSWQWVPLLNTNGQPAVVSLGGLETLKMTSNDSLNANFYMLVPAPSAVALSASLTSSNSPVLSFPTRVWVGYMVVYKDNLQDANWKLLSTITGDGTIKTVTDTMARSQRFYKVVL
jgi:beta-glucosidase